MWPGSAIDQSLGIGWGSTSADHAGGPSDFTVTPKYVVVKLPQAVNVSAIAVDPGNTCGDAGSASTKDYRVETTTSTGLTGATWQLASSGSFTAADRHRLNSLTPATGTGVRSLRAVHDDQPAGPRRLRHTCAVGGYTGCDFMDMSELEVYGKSAS